MSTFVEDQFSSSCSNLRDAVYDLVDESREGSMRYLWRLGRESESYV